MDTGKKPILAVDDDEEFLAYACAALRRGGFAVAAAGTCAQARALIAQGRFSLVLADLRLPDGSGLDLIGEARRHDPLAVGVVMTGHGSVESALEAMREGAYDYLTKPCEPDLLLASVRRAVEHHELKSALLDKTAQLERLQEQLHHRAKMIQNVSHELKNPLAVVYGYSAFLLKQRDECKPEDIERSLHSIHNNAERLNHLLEELLESTRLSGHKVSLDKRPIPAAKLVEDAVLAFAMEARRREVKLSAGPSTKEEVFADSPRVAQVLANLISNALKFTPQAGRVVVSADSAGGFARFCVADTGCGVSRDDLPHLFERFYQARTTKDQHSGLGLGLDISRGLVELHGGRIWAESEPGRGSRFFFTLPKAGAALTAPQ